MQKIAFIFPGQGAQYVGMGQDFFNKYSIARQTYEEASDALNVDMAQICFKGSEEELLLTENTQPAILTTSIAILRVLQQEGFTCDYTAGLSLGEYSALVNAESIEFEKAVTLVRNRGIYMQQSVPNGVGKMGAVIGLPSDRLEMVLGYAREDGVLEIANYNTSQQVVLSGEKDAVKGAIRKAKELGARKALLLPVSAPFHCGLLEPAGKLLKQDLDNTILNNPQIPFVNNVDARIIMNKDEIHSSLIRQVSNSVLWKQSMELLMREGVDTFIEIGPGTTLTNFMNIIALDAQVQIRSASISGTEDLEKTTKLLN